MKREKAKKSFTKRIREWEAKEDERRRQEGGRKRKDRKEGD